jgi:cold shock CspA family protein
LQSIGDESATLLYQGQKLEFKLSKPGGQKAANPKKK